MNTGIILHLKNKPDRWKHIFSLGIKKRIEHVLGFDDTHTEIIFSSVNLILLSKWSKGIYSDFR